MKRSLTHCRTESGFALLVVMLMMVVLGTMMAAYFTLSRTELQLAKASRDSASGFNAAEAGLNLRAEDIRAIFQDYAVPSGVSPASLEACDSGSPGSGDYACQTYNLTNRHSAVTYVEEEAGNPLQITIPPTEPFGVSPLRSGAIRFRRWGETRNKATRLFLT